MNRPTDVEYLSVCVLSVLNVGKFKALKYITFKRFLKRAKCFNKIC
jgi:hypothetical protein